MAVAQSQQLDFQTLLVSERADGTKTRWTFTEIGADSFHWRGEALYPNATDWKLEGEFLVKRRKS